MRKREERKRREISEIKREKEMEERERGRAQNSAKEEKKRERGISDSVEELHTEELENALFRLHSHRLRWVCREREIPAK